MESLFALRNGWPRKTFSNWQAGDLGIALAGRGPGCPDDGSGLTIRLTAAENSHMTILKTAAMLAAAILVGGTTLVNAQAQGSGGPDGMSTAAAATHPPPPKHHKKMYMSAKTGSMHKKGSQKMGTNGGY